MEATLLVDSQCILGEGVQWNMAERRVYWTDIKGCSLWSCSETGEDVRRQDLEGGLCAFAFADSGDILAAFTDGLYRLDQNTGERSPIAYYQPELQSTRMNDGNLDRRGRFVVGGMDEAGMRPITTVWSLSGHGASMRQIIDGVGCCNSIAFSPDGTTMYFADTAGTDIFQFDYDLETGTPSNKRFFARMAPEFGKPDGSTVDAEGCLWNARFGGACVQRFKPDGAESDWVNLPVANVTCCCIGGAQMNRLFVTTAQERSGSGDTKQRSGAGGLFCADLGVKGLDHGIYFSGRA